MQVLGFTWLGIFPDRFEETVEFFAEAVGLARGPVDAEVAQLLTARGDIVEVFRPEARYGFASTGPIPGFQVDDAASASAELRAAGIELLGEPGAWEGHAWQHFRAPDGHVFEVTSGPYRPDSPEPGLPWVGIRTPAFADMVSFARDVLGLQVVAERELDVVLRMGNGDQLEVIAEDDPDHLFMDTGPVAGFQVEDVAAIRPRLVAAGAELLGGAHRGHGSSAWQHFRAPDGRVYEVISRGGYR